MPAEPLAVVGVGIAGGLGAVLRYLTARLVQRRVRSGFPWGTLLVNLSGCFLLGLSNQLLLRGWLGPTSALLLGTGFVSGYTTYSSFNHETLELWRQRAGLLAVLNLAGTVVGCLAAGALGLWLGYSLAPVTP